jgi:DNA-binding PadR family transcriptional regulator
VLRRLEAAGVVAVQARHVQGGTRRLKSYQLTSYGRQLASELRARARKVPSPEPSR